MIYIRLYYTMSAAHPNDFFISLTSISLCMRIRRNADWNGKGSLVQVLSRSASIVHVMKQLRSPTEAHCVDQNVDVEHDVRLDWAPYQGTKKSATESSGVYLLQCDMQRCFCW